MKKQNYTIFESDTGIVRKEFSASRVSDALAIYGQAESEINEGFAHNDKINLIMVRDDDFAVKASTKYFRNW